MVEKWLVQCMLPYIALAYEKKQEILVYTMRGIKSIIFSKNWRVVGVRGVGIMVAGLFASLRNITEASALCVRVWCVPVWKRKSVDFHSSSSL